MVRVTLIKRVKRLGTVTRIGNTKIGNIKIGNTKIGNTKIGNTKIDNTKIGNTKIALNGNVVRLYGRQSRDAG